MLRKITKFALCTKRPVVCPTICKFIMPLSLDNLCREQCLFKKTGILMSRNNVTKLSIEKPKQVVVWPVIIGLTCVILTIIAIFCILLSIFFINPLVGAACTGFIIALACV